MNIKPESYKDHMHFKKLYFSLKGIVFQHFFISLNDFALLGDYFINEM